MVRALTQYLQKKQPLLLAGGVLYALFYLVLVKGYLAVGQLFLPSPVNSAIASAAAAILALRVFMIITRTKTYPNYSPQLQRLCESHWKRMVRYGYVAVVLTEIAVAVRDGQLNIIPRFIEFIVLVLIIESPISSWVKEKITFFLKYIVSPERGFFSAISLSVVPFIFYLPAVGFMISAWPEFQFTFSYQEILGALLCLVLALIEIPFLFHTDISQRERESVLLSETRTRVYFVIGLVFLLPLNYIVLNASLDSSAVVTAHQCILSKEEREKSITVDLRGEGNEIREISIPRSWADSVAVGGSVLVLDYHRGAFGMPWNAHAMQIEEREGCR